MFQRQALTLKSGIFASIVLLAAFCASPVLASGASLEPLAPAPSAETGAAINETPTLWFVELYGAPSADGGSLSAIAAEHKLFRANARKAGLAFREHYEFGTLFNGFSVEIAPAHLSKLNRVTGVKAIYPVDEHSGIVIPKIGANAKVVWGVDWQDSSVYQQALTKGVAHAKGTALPGEPGNAFLFAHSGADFYEAIRYNAEFYLLSKLEAGDEVYLFRDGKKLAYRVTDTRTVSPEEVGYLSGDAKKKTLTLMTCWPAGTTYKRLVVLADQVSE